MIARIDPLAGYCIRDIVSENLVLLQRVSDAHYATGTIQSTRILVAAIQGADLNNLNGRLDCGQVDTEQNSLLFDVPANATLSVTCTVWAEPTANLRTASVQMRQPMNFSLLQSPALRAAGVLLSAPFRDGFED